MRNLNLFLLEWTHFVRSPFKIIALLLFILASVYGLHKGASLYQNQRAEISKIEERAEADRKEVIEDHYKSGNLTPEDKPWVDYSNPFWAVWVSSPYHFKKPSPAMVYSIGQSEQYGFYKRITFWASPYDADLAEEIANPERLQTGTLDFSFALLYLLPLVLLVLLYNLKSMETEQGFMPLVEVQMPFKMTWLFLRVSFYVLLFFIVITALLVYGASLTGVFEEANHSFWQVLSSAALYLGLWSIFYFFILYNGKSILGNTLKMSSVYLLFAFIIPATVHQVLSIRQPANLMTDYIDVRDEEQELYDSPDSIYQARLVDLFPDLVDSPVYQDTAKIEQAASYSASALVNQLNKASIKPIEEESRVKNDFIETTFWFNPVSFFQNRMNTISETHFDDYQTYRTEIQALIDKQISMMVMDLWHEVKADESKFVEYADRITVKK